MPDYSYEGDDETKEEDERYFREEMWRAGEFDETSWEKERREYLERKERDDIILGWITIFVFGSLGLLYLLSWLEWL